MVPDKLFARLAPLAVVVAVVAAGCAGSRPAADAPADIPEAFPEHTESQIRYSILAGADTLEAFRARASLAIRSPERSGTFSADLRSRRNDSLYLSLSPGLGIEAARALVTPDSFYLYNRIENELTYGALRAAGDLLPAPFVADDIFPNLLGIIPPDDDTDWRVEADTAYYYLRSPDGLRLYVVDPARWRVIRYEQRTPSGEIIEERLFSEFDRFGDVYLPRRVVFRRPLEEQTASIYYRDLTLNPPNLSFPLRVSSSAKRKLVR